jgi:hypothetical protein
VSEWIHRDAIQAKACSPNFAVVRLEEVDGVARRREDPIGQPHRRRQPVNRLESN